MAKLALVGCRPVRDGSLKVRQVLLCDLHGFRFVFDLDINHPVGDLHFQRSDLLGP